MTKRIVTQEIQALERTALIELFELDMSNTGGEVYRFHAGVNNLGRPIVWQGETYEPMPIEAEGFDLNAQGVLPRPTVRVANVQGMFSALSLNSDAVITAKFTRKRTFGRFLDAVNFPNGNPEADPEQHLPDQLWFVDRKVSENNLIIEWELASAFDLMGVQLPSCQIIKNSCRWVYRSAECSWTGGMFDQTDQPTTDPTKDRCGKRLGSCSARFGATAVLPFGGFPGASET